MREQRPDATKEHVAESIVGAYRRCGGLAFGYGQGSVFTGFVDDSDLDINLVWDRPDVAGATEIPGATVLSRFDQPGFALEKLHLNGWQVDVAHHVRKTFDGWCEQVRSGDGWQGDIWPLPLYAVSGFVYGVVLEDPAGAARNASDALASFPEPLVQRSRDVLANELPGYDDELAGCARRGDGWLFHHLLTQLMRTAYVAWFSTSGRYCPFPKRISAWASRFGLDPEIADLDRQLWATAELASKRELAVTIAERVLRLR